MAELGMAFLNPIAAAQDMGIKEAEEGRKERAEPSRLAHEAAVTRLDVAQARRMESDTESEAKVAAHLAQKMGQANGKAPDVSSIQLMMAQEYLKEGKLAKAEALFKDRTATLQHEEATRSAAELVKSRQLAENMKSAGEAAQIFGGVHDEASMKDAITFYEKATGQPWKFGTTDYKEAKKTILPYLAKLSMTGYQREELRLKEIEEGRRLRLERERMAQDAFRNQIELRRVVVSEATQAYREKHEGGTPPRPTSAVLKEYGHWIMDQAELKNKPREDYPEEVVSEMALSLAERTIQARRDSKGALDTTQLRRKLWKDMVDNGEVIAPVEGEAVKIPGTELSIPGTKTDKPAQFSPPKVFDSKVPDAKRPVGVYQMGKNKAYWNGTGWTKPPES